MTTANVNDAKSLNSLPMLPKATYVVDRAYNNYRWYYSLDQQGSTFVGRMKINARYRVAKTLTPVGEGILGDEVIELTTERAKKDCPIPLRRVTFIRATDNKKLVFISNDFKRTAEEIAALYKQRWEIELFFKWIKQNLKIKRFMGRNENSVLIQVLVAMIAYLLLRLTQITSYCSLSLQQISRLIAINLTTRISMLALLHPSPDPGTIKKMDSKQLLLRLADA